MDDLSSLLLLAPFAAVIAGMLFLYLGRRGRQIDRHPVCRKCGFDVFASMRSPYRCPECGSRIFPWFGIRVGNRRPITRYRHIAYLLLPLGGVASAIVISSTVASTSAAPHKPVWWLRMEGRYAGDELRDVALNELLHRVSSGRISRTELSPLIDSLLAAQADRSQRWPTAWGAFIENAHAKSAATAPQWARYAAQSIFLDPDGEHNGAYRFIPDIRCSPTSPFVFTFKPSAACRQIPLFLQVDSLITLRPLPAMAPFNFHFSVPKRDSEKLRLQLNPTIQLDGQIIIDDAGTSTPIAATPFHLTISHELTTRLLNLP